MITDNIGFALGDELDWECINSTTGTSEIDSTKSATAGTGVVDAEAKSASDTSSKKFGSTGTEVINAEAKKIIQSMNMLLSKTSTGTATREEKRRLEELTSKLSMMKKEIEKFTTTRHEDSLASLKAKSVTKTNELMKAIKTKQINEVVKAVCDSEAVDLAFLIDCTSSMSPHIEGVKQNIKTIIQQIRSTNDNLQLQLAVVAYRDIRDAQRFEVMDFNSSVHRFEAFLANLDAVGGDDGPEDMAGGVQKANALSWSSPTRVAFLIADAPCHGTEFHNSTDNYPEGSPGISIVEEMRSLLNKQPENGSMNLHFGRITSYTDAMIDRLTNHYGINIDTVPIDDASKLKSSVTSSVRKSIFKTMTLTGLKNRPVSFALSRDQHALIGSTMARPPSVRNSIRSFTLVDLAPSVDEWKKCAATQVKLFKNMKIGSLEMLKSPISYGFLQKRHMRSSMRKHDNTMLMRRAPSPFAQGETRIAFHGQLARMEKDLNLEKNSIIMKVFKHIGEGVNDREQYLKQMEVSNISHFLATEYNKSTARPSHCSKIFYLPVCVVEEEENTHEAIGERRFCVEPPLPHGTFQKYSNNTGYWNEDVLDESLLRFTMWTYVITKGYLMVTDLQGVRNGNELFLTDPVLLCKDIMRFGNTNLGEVFMNKCIDSTEHHLSEHGWN